MPTPITATLLNFDQASSLIRECLISVSDP
jgi:hypothetical protein